jgi:hypothetical protein
MFGLRLRWHSDHDLDHAGIVVEAAGVDLEPRELALRDAAHSAKGPIADALADTDGWFAELTPGESLTMSFEAGPPTGSKRSFVIVVDGHYVTVEDGVWELREYPAAPNPVNPMTTFRFDLPRAGTVSLAVFSVSGRLVRRLVDGTLPAGHHQAVWDGTDAAGRKVAAGVYFCELRTPSGVETQRVTVTN